MKRNYATILATLASAAIVGSADAATIVSYDYEAASLANPTSEAADTSSSATTGTGFGGTGRSSAGNFFGRGISTTAVTSYISFTVTADAGFALELDQLDFDYYFQQSEGTTNDLVTFEARSSVDSFASAISGTYSTNPVGVGAPYEDATFDLTGGSYDGLSSIEFRLYATNNTENVFNDIVRWDNIVVTGDVVPEPSSLALIALGGLCVMQRRRG